MLGSVGGRHFGNRRVLGLPASPPILGFELVRLSGPLRGSGTTAIRGGDGLLNPQLLIAVARAEVEVRRNPSLRSLHSLGVALLQAGDSAAAVTVLRQATRHEGADASIADDLGAALVQNGVAERSLAEIGEGLDVLLGAGDADRSPVVLFNRAVALEALGLREMAVDAWTRYLALDGTSSWAVKARGRLDMLRAPQTPPNSVNPEELEREVLKRQLPGWAEAFMRGREAEARAITTVAAQTAARYLEATGDRSLLDTINLAVAASGSLGSALARGHDAYAAARHLYATEDATGCRREGERAATLLVPTGSPVAALALLTTASCDFLVNDLAGATRHAALARSLVNRRAPPSTVALGQIAWLQGLLAHAQNRPVESVAAYDTALANLEQARDTQRQAMVRVRLADLYDYLGRAGDAWSESVRAVGAEGLPPRKRYLARRTLADVARRQGLHHVSLLVARAMRTDALHSGLTSDLGESYLDVGRAAEAAGNRESATRAYEDALQVGQAMADANGRSRLVAHASVEVARLVVASQPERAESLLAHAEGLAQGEGDFYLAAAQVRADLLRGRGDAEGAERTLRAAIERSDRERRALPTLGWSDDLFARRQDLHHSLILSLADRGLAAPALGVLERWRAEPFPGVAPAAKWGELPDLDASTECVAFLALDDELLVWRGSASGVELTRHPVRREGLAALIATVTDDVQQNAQPAAAARRLASLLFGDRPAQADRLVIAPDELLFAVPFDALPQADGRALLVRSDVVVTPSLWLWAARSGAANGRPGCLLFVAGSPSGGELYPQLAAISNLEDEERAVRDRYQCSDEAASEEELSSVAWNRYDVIHYAGHSVLGGANGGALILRAGSSVTGLEAPALKKLPLHGATVVLSSCSAADGRPSLIAGRDGLARAFLTAGARSVIASLWPVEDEEALELASELHQRLAAGDGPAAALRAAQLALQTRGLPVRAWAPWRVIGGS